MTFSTVTVTWDEVDATGNPAAGSVTFQLTAPLIAPDGSIAETLQKTYFFTSGTGTSDPLAANDSAGALPAGTAYRITIAISGQQPRTFTSQLLHASGASQTLGYLEANAAVPAAQYAQFFPLPSGTALAGQVPAATGAGSASAWTTLTAASVGAASTGALTAEATTRASADTTLATAISAETSRAEGAEGTLSTAIGAETTRATAAEALLLPKAGGTLTGPLVINDVPSGSPSGLPAGYGNSAALTGLQVASSYPSDDVNGGTDGTGRINLYSYQRANTYSFGETIRNTLMRYDAKAMTAWYMPLQGSSGSYTAGYDGSGNVMAGSTFRPVTWTGSHYEANDHASVHAHWELEIPDVTGSLQGRLSVVFGDVTSSAIGLDKTNIATNLADFTFNAYGTDHLGSYQEQYFRVSAPPGFERPVEFNINTTLANVAAGTRWRIVSNATAEGGANTGSDLVIRNYNDSGSFLSSALFIQRSDGQIATGNAGALGARIAVKWGTSGVHGFYASATSTPGSAAAFMATLTATSDRLLQGIITGDTNNRFIAQASGTMLWGPGNVTQDVNLYRASAGLLKTDNSFQAAASLGVGVAPAHVLDVSSAASGQLAGFTRTSTSDTSPVVLVLAGDTSTAQAVGVSVSGDAVSRLGIDPTGKVTWGSGSATRDTNLYRNAAGVLVTDGGLLVGGTTGTALGSAQPEDLGFIGWSYDSGIPGGSSAVMGTTGTAGAGVLQLIKIPVRVAKSCTGVRLYLGTLGSGLTSAQNFVGVYSSAGALIGTSADQTAAWNTGGATGVVDAALTGGPFTVNSPFVWVAVLYNGTTGPSFLRSGNLTASQANGKLSAATSRYGSVTSGNTSLPGSFTPSSVTQLACEFWAALY